MSVIRTRLLKPLLLATALVAAAPAAAFADGPVGNILGVDAVVSIPVGDYGDYSDAALGALVRVELPVTPKLSITGRVGFILDIGNPDGLDTSYIPIYGGIKSTLSGGGTNRLFAFGELGATISRITIEIGNQESSDSETKVGLTGGLGYQSGKVQLRAGLWFPNLADADEGFGLMANIGYDFVQL
jgi:hypothetical protein